MQRAAGRIGRRGVCGDVLNSPCSNLNPLPGKSFSLKDVGRSLNRVSTETDATVSHWLRRPCRLTISLLITIMLAGTNSVRSWAQEVTKQAPPAILPDASSAAGSEDLPVAKVLPEPGETDALVIDSDGPQTKVGSRFVLERNVVLTYRGYRVEADHIEGDSDSGELTATGHLRATGGRNHELITASHGTINLKEQTGRFYDVSGSVGMKRAGGRAVYVSANPFLFTGRLVVKSGPGEYQVYDGTVTSCQLPHPDWILSAGEFTVDSEKARAKNSVFRLMNVPLLYLPYVTQPVDTTGRQSGVLIPVIGQSSTKGLVLGEQLYWALNRSMDLTVGAEYFSLRGWSESATFRYRGLGDDFVRAHYNGLLDRQSGPLGTSEANQGGEDVTFTGRHDFSPETRVVADVEYLSSYVYREAFTENFNQAVSTDILSTVYGVIERNGYAAALEADRYQGLKRVPVPATATTAGSAGQEVRIFHVPSFELSTTDHALGLKGFEWSLGAQATGLKRVQPNFVTNGVTERTDIRPEVAYRFGGGGWRVRPSVAVRDTFYSRSRLAPYPALSAPVELQAPLNRADFEVQVDARAPVVERTFSSGPMQKLFHGAVKHTIEPEFTYRYVNGVDNFLSVLRFDERDVVSDTNELEYGVTQRLFVRPASGRKDSVCGAMPVDLDAPVAEDTEREATPAAKCTSREWISWRVSQKYFFDGRFGGAVLKGRRNIFSSTLDLSGVAFLTEPRELSPLISRLRLRTSENLDLEWDLDLDTGAKKFTANNLLVDVHKGNAFAGLSYALLNAPGRSYVEGVSSRTADFNQMRILLGYGTPSKRGLSVAANAGLDLDRTQMQYGALQTSYNWDCCGLSVEYRKYELGPVRNENAYRFNFTLANIGTAGNLRRAQRLF